MKAKFLLTAFLVFTVAFLWQMAGVIGKLQDWHYLWDPPTVSDMIRALVYALIALGSACGVDLSPFLSTIGSTLKGLFTREVV